MFCGTFDTGGTDFEIGEGKLSIKSPGRITKLINDVAQVTFSGSQALAHGQRVIYVTERAVFVLTELGVELIEIAPGVDVKNDILSCMDFVPIISTDIALMETNFFREYEAL